MTTTTTILLSLVMVVVLLPTPVSSFAWSVAPHLTPRISSSGSSKPFTHQRQGQLDMMIGSLFKWRAEDSSNEEYVDVNIESPSTNVRRISSSIVIDRPPATVWRILTDYDNLASYVPNLVESKTIPRPNGEKAKGVRLYQVSSSKKEEEEERAGGGEGI